MKKKLFGSQPLTRFTADFFAKVAKTLQNILRIFFAPKKRNFYMHSEQMVDRDFSQVKRVLQKYLFVFLNIFRIYR